VLHEDLWRSDALSLTAAIKAREVSAREVVQAHLDRIDAVNGAVNAVVHRFDEDSLKAADRADRAVASGEAVGPLLGVPVAIKINLDVEGQPTDEGLPELADNIASEDAPVVRNLRRAGAIFHARTNMPDLGMRWNTENPLHGATLNPWDPSRTPGGSSGGDGVAVATGMAPIGIGNDFGGSVRLPAAYNGVVGMRPTPGQVPNPVETDGGMAIREFFTHGPLARTASDIDLAFQSMRRHDARDPWWVGAVPASTDPSRVIVVRNIGDQAPDPDVVAGIEAAAAALAGVGYRVEDQGYELPRLEEAAHLWRDITHTEIEMFLEDEHAAMGSDAARRWLQASIANARIFDGREYAKAWIRRSIIASEWSKLMGEGDLILAPVDPQLPWPRVLDSAEDLADTVASLYARYALNFVGTLLGLAAVTLPVGVGESGLPRPVQLIGWRFNEARALAAAKAIEPDFPPPTPIDPRGSMVASDELGSSRG